MDYIIDYSNDLFLEQAIDSLYEELFEGENTTRDVLIGGTASGVGWAVGSELFDKLKKKNIVPNKSSAAKFIPFAIAGAALIAGATLLVRLIKKKKDIKYLINNEKNPAKKDALKKQLNSLSKKEILELKKYKQTEAKAKLQAKVKISKEDKKKLAGELYQGALNKAKIDNLKKAIDTRKEK